MALAISQKTVNRMSLKQALLSVMEDRLDQEYKRKCANLQTSYNEWIRDKEKAQVEEAQKQKAGRKQKEEEPLHVFYDELETEGLFREKLAGLLARAQKKQAPFLIFERRQGEEGKSAVFLIRDFFDKHPEISLLYGDEDEISEEGKYRNPYFKPDWSPDTYLSCFYPGSLFAIRTKTLQKLVASKEGEVFSPWQEKGLPPKMTAPDLLFCLLARQEQGFARRRRAGEDSGTISSVEDAQRYFHFPIGHLPEVLFHRNAKEDLYLGRNQKQELLSQFHREESGEKPSYSVSIIIPSKDNPQLLKQCLHAVMKTVCAHGEDAGISYEFILVDNGSSTENRRKIETLISSLPKTPGFLGANYVYQPEPFNFSRMCNRGAEEARTDYLLFLNDDVEALTEGWLSEMLYFAEKPWTGAVGVKLLYPNCDLIQHCGIANIRIGPVHKLQHFSDSKEYYFGYNRGVHDMIGVTGACLLTRAGVFREMGGFPEDMAVAFNDVELNYHLFESGYYNVCCNNVFLYHHESLSRGDDLKDLTKMARMERELTRLMEIHEDLDGVDPFLHRYISDNENMKVQVTLNEIAPPNELPFTSPKCFQARGKIRRDAVVRAGVEYTGLVSRYLRTGRDSRKSLKDGYLIQGYTFVIGDDNALYEKKLILERLRAQKAEDPIGGEAYVLPVEEVYRPEIAEQIPDQKNVNFCGFRVRMRADALPEGDYRVGILMRNRVHRQKLYDFGVMLFHAGPGKAAKTEA